MAILTDVRWYCSFNLHFSNNTWCWTFFMCLLGICMSSLEKCLFRSSALFFFFCITYFFILRYMNCFYILEINTLAVASFANILLHSESCLLVLNMATHSSPLAWKIPWAEEAGRLQSMGSGRVQLDWATSLSLFTFSIGEGHGNPLQCSCLENPRDGGAWWAAVYGVTQSPTRLKRLSSSNRMVFFAVQKLLSLIRSHLLIFIFITLGGGSEKTLLQFIFCLFPVLPFSGPMNWAKF